MLILSAVLIIFDVTGILRFLSIINLLGEYFYYKKEKKKSKEFFEQIVNLENANLEIKNEAKKRILRDFSE